MRLEFLHVNFMQIDRVGLYVPCLVQAFASYISASRVFINAIGKFILDSYSAVLFIKQVSSLFLFTVFTLIGKFNSTVNE